MTTSSREQLKKEICSYFLKSGVSKEVLPKAIAAFKECADEGREFESFFGLRHHVALQEFQSRYWALDELFEEQEMSKDQAEDIFADPQASPSLLKEAARVLDSEPDINDAIGEIAKYLPMSATPTEAALNRVAYQVLKGELTAKEAADRLSNKKILIKRS